MNYDHLLSVSIVAEYTIVALFVWRLVWWHWRYRRGRVVLALLVAAALLVTYPIFPYGYLVATGTEPPGFTAVWLRPWVLGIGLGVYALTETAYSYGKQQVQQAEFVANASHEMRTPLNIILGFSEMQSNAHWPTVYRAGRRLQFVVENLLGVSRLEHSGRLPMAPVDLAEAVGESVEGMEMLAQRGDVELIANLHRAMVCGSEPFLVLLANNLISNAIKFTPVGGQVHVTTYQGNDTGVLRVIDTGIGITKEVQGKMWRRFVQGDGSDTRPFSGVGLGLYFVRLIIKAHGGRVTVDSNVGVGSIFTVWLPKAEAVTAEDDKSTNGH